MVRYHISFDVVSNEARACRNEMYGTWEGGLPKDMSTEEADEYFGRVWRISCTKRSFSNPMDDECEGCARCGWNDGGVAAEGVLCECRYLHCYAGRDAVIVKMRKRLIYEGGRSGSPSRPHVVELTATAHRREDRSTGRHGWELGDTAYRMPRQLSVGQMMNVRLADLNLSTRNLETGW